VRALLVENAGNFQGNIATPTDAAAQFAWGTDHPGRWWQLWRRSLDGSGKQQHWPDRGGNHPRNPTDSATYHVHKGEGEPIVPRRSRKWNRAVV